MTARGQTRERLLRTAGELFRRQGYGATGLSQVIAESGSPKGVVYFHFPGGKEQLAAESVAAAGAELGARMATAIGQANSIPGVLAAVGGLLAADLEGSGFQDGCPVATVALDAANHSQQIRDACRAVYDSWLAGLARCLRSQGIAPEEADELSGLILSSLQGALLLARVRRDVRVVSVAARRLGELAEAAARSASAECLSTAQARKGSGQPCEFTTLTAAPCARSTREAQARGGRARRSAIACSPRPSRRGSCWSRPASA